MYNSSNLLIVAMDVKDVAYGLNVGDIIFTYKDLFFEDYFEVGKEYFIFGGYINSFAFPENMFSIYGNDFFLEVKENSLVGLSENADKFLKSTKSVLKMKELVSSA